jgi:hypothetical protein
MNNSNWTGFIIVNCLDCVIATYGGTTSEAKVIGYLERLKRKCPSDGLRYLKVTCQQPCVGQNLQQPMQYLAP